ncbi:C-type lectin domain family 17, member A-like [Pogoniulus pusillus]|uniref:C-type lectin domain family 17, member A-like n=1 Tax=Pogoniulus pusillus TaxID=488313 RepID=UPI0030B98DD2
MSTEGPNSSYEKWDLMEGMELEKEEQRKGPKEVLFSLPCPAERAIGLLYLLLALTLVLFTALTIVNLRRVSSAWAALEEAQMRTKSIHAAAWHNLSEVQQALDLQLSNHLQALSSQLLNVSQEMEKLQREAAQGREEGGKELEDRIRALEDQDLLKPLLQQLEEMRQEQNRSLVSLEAALEAVHNLSGILCTRCPPGWLQFARTCYYFSTTTKPWLQAKDFCAELGAHLVVVESEQENKFLANQVMQNRVFWLGLADTHQEGHWQWLGGASLSLSFWDRGEPNNAGQQGEDCATLLSSGFWNDVSCASSAAWVCERAC